MLVVTIPEVELYDEQKNEFIYVKPQKLQLEHSLVSISKWEAKWQKPFLGSSDIKGAELIDYIRCMTLTQNVDADIYNYIPSSVLLVIKDYIQNPMTATTITKRDEAPKTTHEIITSELIYYWMISLQIPMECQKWHLNRLLTLIRVCSIKNQPSKKMDSKSLAHSNHSLNQARRAAHGSKG